MSRRVAGLLAACIDDVQAGQRTVDDCLRDHPLDADELRPLLELVVAFPESGNSAPSAFFRARGRSELLREIEQRPRRRGWRWPTAWPATRLIWASGLAVALLAGGGGVVVASRDALPGDTLYGVKQTVEEARLTFATSNEAKAAVHLDIAGTRLDEVERALDRDRPDAASRASEDYLEHVDESGDLLLRAATSGKNICDLLAELDERVAEQQQVFDRVSRQVPPQAQGAIARASANAEREADEIRDELLRQLPAQDCPTLERAP